MGDDYYKILGISRNASPEEIKTAYRKLAHKYHPDKAGGNEAMFKKINEAYQVLSNHEKRAQYDRFGKTFSGSAGAGGGMGGFDWRNFSDGVEFGFDMNGFGGDGNMGDVFDAFFEGLGVKRKRRAYERGSDLELAEEVTLEEAFRGAKRDVKFRTFISCKKCEGIGHFPKDGFSACTSCDGRGEIQETRKTFFGNFAQIKTCDKCHGLGKIPKKACDDCRGTGRVESEKKVEVSVAPGIADGQLIKISKGGEMGAYGAEAGDLYVRIRVKPHHLFKRHGDDLVIEQKADLIELLTARKIEVKTIAGGTVVADIPSDFRLGEQVVISGEGMPRLGGIGRGRLVVNLDVRMPKKLSDKAKKLLEELKRELSD
jgi:molecular chaperone DnaJ